MFCHKLLKQTFSSFFYSPPESRSEARSERIPRSKLRGLAPSVYEWNRECRD